MASCVWMLSTALWWLAPLAAQEGVESGEETRGTSSEVRVALGRWSTLSFEAPALPDGWQLLSVRAQELPWMELQGLRVSEHGATLRIEGRWRLWRPGHLPFPYFYLLATDATGEEERFDLPEIHLFVEAPPADPQAGPLWPSWNPAPRVLAPWVTWTLAGLPIVLLGIGALWRRRRAAAGVPSPPRVIDPYDHASAQLSRLATWPLHGEDEHQAFHHALSAALRSYVESRLGLRATDMTTAELRHALAEGSWLPASLERKAVALLRAYDQVKFAGRRAGESYHRSALQETREVIDQIEAWWRETKDTTSQENPDAAAEEVSR